MWEAGQGGAGSVWPGRLGTGRRTGFREEEALGRVAPGEWSAGPAGMGRVGRSVRNGSGRRAGELRGVAESSAPVPRSLTELDFKVGSWHPSELIQAALAAGSRATGRGTDIPPGPSEPYRGPEMWSSGLVLAQECGWLECHPDSQGGAHKESTSECINK